MTILSSSVAFHDLSFPQTLLRWCIFQKPLRWNTTQSAHQYLEVCINHDTAPFDTRRNRASGREKKTLAVCNSAAAISSGWRLHKTEEKYDAWTFQKKKHLEGVHIHNCIIAILVTFTFPYIGITVHSPSIRSYYFGNGSQAFRCHLVK